MNFDDLVNIVNNLKNEKSENCMICHFPSDLIKLKCTHFYHYNCIKINKCENDITKIITCPYCHITSFLIDSTKENISLAENILSKENISLAENILSKENISLAENILPIEKKLLCPRIIKSGINKGNVCNKIECKKHKNKIKINLCKIILKTGKMKGTLCNRSNCKIHNIIV
jgi:hypothetical protein